MSAATNQRNRFFAAMKAIDVGALPWVRAHKPGTKACRSAPPCSPGLRPQDRRDIIWVLQA